MDSDEYKYLQPNFDPNTLKVAELRNILVRHDVEFNMAAKKSELIDLFKADIARRAPTLRRELNRPSAKPVTTPKDIERVMIRKERTPEPEPSDSKKPPSAPRTPRRSTKKVQASSATAKPSVVGKKRGIDSRSSTEHSDASGGETADKPKPVRKPRVAGTARRSDSEIDPGSKLEKRPPVRRAEAVPPKQETRDSKFVSKREAEGKREPTSSPPSSPKVEKPVTPSGTPSRKRKAQDREDEEGGDKKEGDKAEAEETSTRHLPPLTPSKKKKKNKTEVTTPEKAKRSRDLHFRRQTGNFSDDNPFQSSPESVRRRSRRAERTLTKSMSAASSRPPIASPLRGPVAKASSDLSGISNVRNQDAGMMGTMEPEESSDSHIETTEPDTSPTTSRLLSQRKQRSAVDKDSGDAHPRVKEMVARYQLQTTEAKQELLPSLSSNITPSRPNIPVFDSIRSPLVQQLSAAKSSGDRFTMTPGSLREMHAVSGSGAVASIDASLRQAALQQQQQRAAWSSSMSGTNASTDNSQGMVRRRPGLPDFGDSQDQQMTSQRQRADTLRRFKPQPRPSLSKPIGGGGVMKRKGVEGDGVLRANTSRRKNRVKRLALFAVGALAVFSGWRQHRQFAKGFIETRSGGLALTLEQLKDEVHLAEEVGNAPMHDFGDDGGTIAASNEWWRSVDGVVQKAKEIHHKYIEPQGLRCPPHATCVPYIGVPPSGYTESNTRRELVIARAEVEYDGTVVRKLPVMVCDEGYKLEYSWLKNNPIIPIQPPDCVRDVSTRLRVQGMANAIISECQLHRGKGECDRTVMAQVGELIAKHPYIQRFVSPPASAASEPRAGAEDLDIEDIETLGLSKHTLRNMMWGRAGYRLGKEEFDQLFDQAIALIEQLDERQVEPFIITEEDDDESSAEVLSTSDERSLYYVADMAQYPLACRVRRAVLSQLISNIHWVGVGLVGLVMASVGRRRLETIRAEKRAADALVLTAIRRLRDQATKHYLDPVLYPSPAISSNQLRDLLLLNSPSPASSASMTPSEDGRAGGGGDSGMLRLSFFDPRVRQRVWEHVKKVVERNTNVRCRTMAIKGELMRTWEWIGPLDIAGPNATAPVGPPLVLEPED